VNGVNDFNVVAFGPAKPLAFSITPTVLNLPSSTSIASTTAAILTSQALRTIHVAGLSNTITTDQLRNVFSQIGTVVDVCIYFFFCLCVIFIRLNL
jgi:hypothetical protein